MVENNDKFALAKVFQIKTQKQKRYAKNKAIGKCREWDSKRRRAKLWTSIEKKIDSENKCLNESWVLWNKEKVTPLIAVIKQGDLRAVGLLLGMKACPSISWSEKGHSILPLEEALWLGHEDISRLLLENGACKEK